MTLLILGLLIFFGTHAITMARGLRGDLVARLGPGPFKGGYTALSLLGFGLIIWGFVQYRASGYIPVWQPPRAMAHVAMTLMLVAMIMLMVYLLPAGRLKAALKHPMLVMIKVWALAHLLANGDLGSIILFGSFLVYAVINRIAVKRRGGDVLVARGWTFYDGLAIILGAAAYLALVYGGHALLFGVPVLPGR